MRKIFKHLLILITLFNLSTPLIACQIEKKPVFNSITSALKATKLTIFSVQNQDVEYLKKIIALNILISLLTTDFQNNITFNFLQKDQLDIEVLNQATQAPIDNTSLAKIQTLTVIIKVLLFLTFVTLSPSKLHIEAQKTNPDLMEQINQFNYSLYTNFYANKLVYEGGIFNNTIVPFVIGAHATDYIKIWNMLLFYLNYNMLYQFCDEIKFKMWESNFRINEILIKKNQKLQPLTDQDLTKPRVINLVIKYQYLKLDKQSLPVDVRIIEP